MRLLLICAAAAALTACATREETVAVPYTPSAAATVPGVDQVRVTVTATDARTTNRGRISSKINGYGMEMAAIRSEAPVTVIAQRAIEAELKQRGFQVGQNGGATVNAAVETFFNEFNAGFWQGKASAQVRMTVTVSEGDRAVYRRTISGEGGKGIMTASGGNAASALSLALSAAMTDLFADPDFIRAARGEL